MKKTITLVSLITFFFTFVASPQYSKAIEGFPWEMFLAATTGKRAEVTIATILDPSSPIISIATSVNGEETVAILGDKDSHGNVIRVTEFIYYISNGTFLMMKLDSDGIPVSLTDNSGKKLLFSDYNNGTVTVKVFDKNNNQIGNAATILINQKKLNEGMQLLSSVNRLGLSTKNQIIRSESSTEECTEQSLSNVIIVGVKVASLYISTLVLAGAVIFGGASSVIAGATISVFLAMLSLLPLVDDNNQVFRVVRVVQIKLDEIDIPTGTDIISNISLFAARVLKTYYKPCPDQRITNTKFFPLNRNPEITYLGVEIMGNREGKVWETTNLRINCPIDCEYIFKYDEKLTLKAKAFSGSIFKYWTGSCSGTNPEIPLSMNFDKICAAHFEPEPPVEGNVTIDSAYCDSRKPYDVTIVDRLEFSGTASGPVGTRIINSSPTHAFTQNCPEWEGYCHRDGNEPSTTTWTAFTWTNKMAPFDVTLKVTLILPDTFQEIEVSKTITCPEL